MTYSKTNTVDVRNNTALNIWPVPAKNLINIQIKNRNYSKANNIVIFNHAGQKIIIDWPHDGVNTIDISSLPAGYYLITIHLSGEDTLNQNFIKL